MNSPVKLVIFDWDGTLFDSVGQIVASLQFAAQQFQQPLTDADAKSIIGLGLPEVAQRLFPVATASFTPCCCKSASMCATPSNQESPDELAT